MAEKTAELAGDEAKSRQRAMEAKLEAIADMRRIATSRDHCVRQDVASYFGAIRSRRRRSLAVRIVEWALTRRVRQEKPDGTCCDSCDGVDVADAGGVVAWSRSVFAQHAGSAAR